MEKYLKLIEFYSKMFTSGYMNDIDLLKMYREFLKDYIRICKSNPSYDKDSKWKLYREGNCYCYSLMIPTPEVFISNYRCKSGYDFSHDIGFISGKEYSDDIDVCYDNLRSDLDFLGINYYDSDIDSSNKHDGYKIAFYKSIDDFHFLRQNNDGTWSHKKGYDQIIERINPEDTLFDDFKLIKTLEIVK